jgi:hypothetical protein
MQDKIAPKSNFLHRTDLLAQTLGCNIKGLEKHTGLSARTIIASRKGAKISAKTWAKLEAAERKAGIPVRRKSHMLLSDYPLYEQSSDEHMSAIRREMVSEDAEDWRSILKQAASLAAGLFPEDESRREVFLDVFIELKTEIADLRERCDKLEAKTTPKKETKTA